MNDKLSFRNSVFHIPKMKIDLVGIKMMTKGSYHFKVTIYEGTTNDNLQTKYFSVIFVPHKNQFEYLPISNIDGIRRNMLTGEDVDDLSIKLQSICKDRLGKSLPVSQLNDVCTAFMWHLCGLTFKPEDINKESKYYKQIIEDIKFMFDNSHDAEKVPINMNGLPYKSIKMRGQYDISKFS